VANGALVELGYNATVLGKPQKDFAGIRITTPDGDGNGVIRTMAALTGVSGGCVGEVGNINPVCTANDVRLAGVKEVTIAAGDSCDLTDPNDTITVQSFTGIFTSGPQRYDIGSYIATDGGGADGARLGSCRRFGFANGTTGLTDLDGDSCADIGAGVTNLEIPNLGPITIKCSDAFHLENGIVTAGSDGNVDFFHCETWAQQKNEIICQSSTNIKAGTPSKCGCGLIDADAGFCVVQDDLNPCTDDVCRGSCQNDAGTGSGDACGSSATCAAGNNETCRSFTPQHIANSNSCSDGNACTTDSCQAGVCTGTNSVTCTASDQCHVAGTCNTSTGVCSDPAKADGSGCTDGNACTSDSCQAGVCTGTNSVTCTASDQCHVAGTCNTSTGVCSDPAKADGSGCSDGSACTTDSCQAGVCTGTNSVTCAALDQCHVAGTCNTSTGVCSNPAAPDGTECTDHNACTQSETCSSGVCGGGTPVLIPN
jgi:hypothetical protein